MAKIKHDKYYTPSDLAKYCVNKTKEIIGEDNIVEYIEPSAGQGVFLDYLDKPYLAYDIEPEDDRVEKADWLGVDLNYKQGRCVIGNPPFGSCNTLSVQFYKKAIKLCDYIAFILPISQLNNNQQMYDFDLIHSEDLGIKNYSGVELQCCFNIYKRPDSDKLNKKPNYKLQDVDIIEYRRGGNDKQIPDNYDYAMGSFGAGCVGKPIVEKGQFALECYFYINNEGYKERILDILKMTDWVSIARGISGTCRLPQWKIYKYLKEQIPELN